MSESDSSLLEQRFPVMDHIARNADRLLARVRYTSIVTILKQRGVKFALVPETSVGFGVGIVGDVFKVFVRNGGNLEDQVLTIAKAIAHSFKFDCSREPPQCILTKEMSGCVAAFEAEFVSRFAERIDGQKMITDLRAEQETQERKKRVLV